MSHQDKPDYGWLKIGQGEDWIFQVSWQKDVFFRRRWAVPKMSSLLPGLFLGPACSGLQPSWWLWAFAQSNRLLSSSSGSNVLLFPPVPAVPSSNPFFFLYWSVPDGLNNSLEPLHPLHLIIQCFQLTGGSLAIYWSARKLFLTQSLEWSSLDCGLCCNNAGLAMDWYPGQSEAHFVGDIDGEAGQPSVRDASVLTPALSRGGERGWTQGLGGPSPQWESGAASHCLPWQTSDSSNIGMQKGRDSSVVLVFLHPTLSLPLYADLN